jgi:hypothetical protein
MGHGQQADQQQQLDRTTQGTAGGVVVYRVDHLHFSSSVDVTIAPLVQRNETG